MDLLVSGNYLHLFAFNQCFAKADISGDVCFLFRKLYQVSVNAKVRAQERAVRSESKTIVVDAHAEVCSPEEKGNSCSMSQTSEINKAEGKL